MHVEIECPWCLKTIKRELDDPFDDEVFEDVQCDYCEKYLSFVLDMYTEFEAKCVEKEES